MGGASLFARVRSHPTLRIKEFEMATEIVFAIALGALAVLLIGTVLLVRNRIDRKMGESTTERSFKDCYELCATDPTGGTSRSCTTDCLSYGGV